MRPYLRLVTPIFFVIWMVCFGQATQMTKKPGWFSARWTHNDSEFHAIRTQVEELWSTGKATEAQVDSLVQRFVNPFQKEAGQWVVTKKVPQKPLFWALCLTAYFPSYKASGPCRGFGGGLQLFLLDAPLPASYEFTRVAYCVFESEASFRLPDTSLLDRLLAKQVKDPIVRWHTVISGGGNGFKPIHTRILQMAEELFAEYPHHQSVFRPLLTSNCFTYWQRSNEPKYLHRALKLLDESIASTNPSDVRKRAMRRQLREFYVKQGKAAGVKIDRN